MNLRRAEESFQEAATSGERLGWARRAIPRGFDWAMGSSWMTLCFLQMP